MNQHDVNTSAGEESSSDPEPNDKPPVEDVGWRLQLESLRTGSLRERFRAFRTLWDQLRFSQAAVELWQGDKQLQRLELDDLRYRVGRDPDCELTVDSQSLSRVHAIIERTHSWDRDYSLEDFNSANGLFHRDRRIRAISLRDGDEIGLGSSLKGDAPRFRYRHPRSLFEQLLHWIGLGALFSSGLLVSGMLLVATVGGGSKIRTISGPVKIVSGDRQQIDSKQGSAVAMPSLEYYPVHLRHALMASEEARFGWNSGIDLFGTIRSFVKATGGGSGLTQQVARMYYPDVGRDYTYSRKLRELWVALQLETGFDKNRILKMYLDRAFLGKGVNGFEQGSQLYFRKSARDLNRSESAFLVGLLPSPNYYSPCISQTEKADKLRKEILRSKTKLSKADESKINKLKTDKWSPIYQRNHVLKAMHKNRYITDKQLIDLQRTPLNIDPSACRNSNFSSHPFFSDYVIGELEGKRFGLTFKDDDGDGQFEEGGNWYVVSTINPTLQHLAESELRTFLAGPAVKFGLTQGALISLDFTTGEILAYVGGGNYSKSSYDRVQALRQPGSTFKLFSYLSALEAGVAPHDQISCAPISYITGCHMGRGSMSMVDGFAYSENVVAVRLADKAGLNEVIRKSHQLGISDHPTKAMPPDYNTVLGGYETYLYEMARAYAVVANGGRSVPMHGVKMIYDLGVCQSEKNLKECPAQGVTKPRKEKVQVFIKPELSAVMDNMLRRVVSSGTGRAAGVVADARGKTGTTNEGVDVLFIGYSPKMKLLTAIWMGNDDNTATRGSSALAAELWGRFMTKAGKAGRAG